MTGIERTPTGFVFDDEPLGSILYDEPGSGPTPAGLFASTKPIVAKIVQTIEQGEIDEGFSMMAELLACADPVSIPDLIRFTWLIGSLIPPVPCPIVEDRGVPYEALLEPLFAAGLTKDEDALVDRAGMALYRYYEGCGRYTDAARVVGFMLERVKKNGNAAIEAVFTNNLGYEHLLNSDLIRAEACFARAVELFGAHDIISESANARLNLLLARYELAGGEPPERFEAEANELLAALGDDWRRRKALILLARIAERRGDFAKAIELARQAVDASGDIPTRHRLYDRQYLERLEGRRS